MKIKGSKIRSGMIIRFEYGLENNWVIAEVIAVEKNIITFAMLNSCELHQVVIEADDEVQLL